MSTGNTRQAERKAELAAFDRLPVDIRRALGRTIRNWSAVSALQCIEEYGMPAWEVAKMIGSMDKEQALKEGGGRHNPSHIG